MRCTVGHFFVQAKLLGNILDGDDRPKQSVVGVSNGRNDNVDAVDIVSFRFKTQAITDTYDLTVIQALGDGVFEGMLARR